MTVARKAITRDDMRHAETVREFAIAGRGTHWEGMNFLPPWRDVIAGELTPVGWGPNGRSGLESAQRKFELFTRGGGGLWDEDTYNQTRFAMRGLPTRVQFEGRPDELEMRRFAELAWPNLRVVERKVYTLYWVGRYPVGEISQRLKLRKSTVRSIVLRLRKKKIAKFDKAA